MADGARDRPAQGLTSELARLEQALAELSAANIKLEQEQEDVAGQLQLVKRRRDLLANAIAEREQAGAARTARRPPPQPPPPPPPTRARVQVAPPPPEASASSVQTVMLGLGALLLGIAAVVFVAVAFTGLVPWSQLVILLGVTVLFLGVAPAAAARGLTATAETLSAVGLLLVALAGYPLWTTEAPATVGMSVYSGLVAAVTAAVGYGYYRLTGLQVPRWVAVLAAQPVLPLLAYPTIGGAAEWGLAFAMVAALNIGFGVAWRTRAVGYFAWVLHAAALGLGGGFAVAGMLLADTVPAALPGAGALVFTGGVALAGGLAFRRQPLHSPAPGRLGPADIAAGLFTLSVIGASSRLVALALPGQALLPIAAIATAATIVAARLPASAKRGPLRAAAWTLALLGVIVAGLSLRAGAAAVVWPPWPDDWPAGFAGYQQRLSEAVGPATWQLAFTAVAATVGAGLSLPAAYRREVTVAGAALAALAMPASFALPPELGAWVLAVVAAGLSLTGLTAGTRRAAICHLAGSGLAGLGAAGVSLAAPSLTATVVTALTISWAVAGSARPRTGPAELVTTWSAGKATLALPGATAAGAAAAGLGAEAVIAAGFAGLCVSLGYAALVQLQQGELSLPVRLGTGLATVAVLVGTVAAEPARVDLGIALLLAAAALLVIAAPRIDAVRRPDRWYDAADLAAAAVVVATIATLARITALTLPITGPDAGLATGAVLVFGVGLGVWLVPESIRRGPVLGVAVAGAVVAGIAGVAAVVDAIRVLAAAGPVWRADLSGWPLDPTIAGLTWSVPFALGLLAVLAAVVLPSRARPQVSAGLAVLATLGAPIGLGLDWWTPAALSAAVGTWYALASVVRRPGTALPRAVAAAVLFGYAACASLPRAWATAAVLGTVALVGTVVATLAARSTELGDPRRRIGGAAVTAALLALPGTLAAYTAELGHPAGTTALAALGGCGLGLAVMALVRAVRPATTWPYLPYATVGVTVAATATALATLPTDLPTEVYAAAAGLLAVLAELVRAAHQRRWPLVPPSVGALVAAAVPTGVALIAIVPALAAALVVPYQTLTGIWQGPPPGLANPQEVAASSVLAALLLTLAAALAAVGFGGAVTRQTVPLIAPGLAVTLLIAPAALDAPWPASTGAALAVFTFSMLGVALSPPPPRGARPLWVTRRVVLGIGLAAGGAGLAGALASPALTWATLGGAVLVGLTAGLGGRTWQARLLGWVFATGMAQAFALTTAYLFGAGRPQYGFALLAVAAVALLAVPRLRITARELTVVEAMGGYASIGLALLLALDSTPDLAAMLVGTGAILGLAAVRRGRTHRHRRVLWWSAAISEVAAWWLIMRVYDVGVLEAYTLPFAVFALLVGALEVRYRPELGSWVTYGPGLTAAFGPSLLVVITTEAPEPVRLAWVILGGVGTLLLGARLRQRAPLIIGSVVTALAALRLLSLAGPWLMLIPLGILLLVLGANREKRQRDLDRLRGAYSRMR